MLNIKVRINEREAYDEVEDLFTTICDSEFDLELEHSLVSLSKWESKFEKPFLGDQEKTAEEALWYIEAMTLTPNIPPEVFTNLSEANIQEINEYINAKMTATWFTETETQSRSRQTITSELIYSWMVTLQINWEAQYWHLNRLITLVRVLNEQNKPEKAKRSRSEMARERAELNRRRLAEMNAGN